MMWSNCGQYVCPSPASESSASESSASESSASESSASELPASESPAPESSASESSASESSASESPVSESCVFKSCDTLAISRRKSGFGRLEPVTTFEAGSQKPFDPNHARNISDLQTLSEQHTAELSDLCPIAFWRVLDAVLEQSKRTQTKVFQAVAPLLNTRDTKTWPKTRESLDYKLQQRGCISARWRRTVHIDLSHVGLQGLQKPVTFTFIDPIFAWVTCAAKLSHKHELHFTHRERVDPKTGEKLYGSSVQQGEYMREACRRTPRSPGLRTGPALIGLSWDAGNASKRRSYTPVLISVGNTDYSGLDVCTCLGYLPTLPLCEKDLCRPEGKRATHELRQKCAEAIIDVIESTAKTGFRCLLSTGGNAMTIIPYKYIPRSP